MADNFYAQWFSRTQPRRLTPEELWQRDTDQLRSMATSEFGEFCKERFNIPEVTDTFSSSVILERASSTRASIGAVLSRYTGVLAIAPKDMAARAIDVITDRFIIWR